MGWWERRQQRQQDLAQGADADLVRDNRRRWLASLGLFAFGLLLLWSLKKMLVPSPWRTILIVVGAVCAVIGLILSEWARWEWRFLRREDPEEPPSILKG